MGNHRSREKPDGSWTAGVFVCVNLCAGGWVRKNETALIPRPRTFGAGGGIEHSLEGTTLTASLNTPGNVFTHTGLREI